jgi:hypothetical protein
VGCVAERKDPDMYPGIVPINVRTLHDVDLKSLRIKSLDVKRLWNMYGNCTFALFADKDRIPEAVLFFIEAVW